MQLRQTITPLAVAACLALPACAGDGDGGSGGNARKGGSITIGATGAPDSLDPAVSRSREAGEALWLVYTPPLTYRRSEGAKGTELIPGLAEDMPSVSEDGETYTFKIRKGLRYSDGKPVRAGDFEHTIKRVLRLGEGARFFTSIEGAEAYAAGSDEEADISGIQTDDRSGQVTVTLTRRDPTFQNKLATTYAGVVPRKTPFEDRSRRPPPGVGPYKIAKVSSREFVMTQVAGFDLPDIPEGNVQRIATRVVPSEARGAQAVIDGRLDYMQGPIPVELLPEIRSKYKDRYTEQANLSTFYFFLNERTPPFDSQRVRKAVNFALDTQALLRIFAGRLAPGCNLLAPGLPGFSKIDPCHSGDPRLSGDPEKARQLIEDADEEGKAVTVFTDDEGNHRAIGRYYTGLLDKIGLKARLRVVDAKRYEKTIARGMGAQTGLGSYVAELPHPLPFVSLVGENALDPALGERISELADEPDVQEAADGYRELDRRIVDRANVAPFGSEKIGTFLSERMDAENCAIFHRVFGNDYSSFCLR